MVCMVIGQFRVRFELREICVSGNTVLDALHSRLLYTQVLFSMLTISCMDEV